MATKILRVPRFREIERAECHLPLLLYILTKATKVICPTLNRNFQVRRELQNDKKTFKPGLWLGE